MSTVGLSLEQRHTRPFWKGLWRLSDPKISLASITALAVGTAYAAAETRISAAVAALVFACILMIEVGKNAVNDLYDFRSGTDSDVWPQERTPFSGGKRVLVDHLLTEGQLIRIGWYAFTIAAALALALSVVVSPVLLIVGVIGVAISYAYSAPPIQLSYRGLGELAVFLVYGPGLILGIYAALTSSLSAAVITASLTMGLLIANVLLVNEFPDERPDREAGKRTLLVKLGRQRATILVEIVWLVAFSIPLAAVTLGLPRGLLGSLLGAPFAIVAFAELLRNSDCAPVRAQALTLAAYVAAGLGLILTTGW